MTGDGAGQIKSDHLPKDQLRIEVSRKGGERWHVMLARDNIPLVTSGRYVLRFRARADRPKLITGTVAQAHEPWNNLGLSYQTELSEEWRDFEADFICSSDDENAGLRFWVGDTDVAVEFAEIELVWRGANTIAENWRIRNKDSAKATLVHPSRETTENAYAVGVRIENPGTDIHDVQLWHENLSLEAGRRYKLQFRARSPAARDLHVSAIQAHPPWSNLGLFEKIALSTQWQDFLFDFVANASEDAAGICFPIGQQNVPLAISSFQLNEIRADPVPADTVQPDKGLVDTATITNKPTVRAQGDWQLNLQGNAVAMTVPLQEPAGAIRVELERCGAEPWHVQLSKGPLVLKARQSYVVSFRARADEPREAGYGVFQLHKPWSRLSAFQKTFFGTNWQLHRLRFVAEMNEKNAGLNFYLGEDATSVELADVAIKAEVQEDDRSSNAFQWTTVVGLGLWGVMVVIGLSVRWFWRRFAAAPQGESSPPVLETRRRTWSRRSSGSKWSFWPLWRRGDKKSD